MKHIHYIIITWGLLFISSCDFSESVEDARTHSGSADFSTYIALGNSLTAGYQDGALYKEGQEHSYPAMIAKGMNLSYDFAQPLMADNLGGIPSVNISNKRILAKTSKGLLPIIAEGEAKTTLASFYKGKQFYNLGVPGAKLSHLLAAGYGNPAGLLNKPATANPYYVRFASSSSSSIIEDALAAKPSFFSLWIGNNDVLGYATSGGDDSEALTAENTFSQHYKILIERLTSSGAKGVIANIPYVTTIPFFNTVPNDALLLDAEKAKKLSSFFTAVQGILTKVLINKGIPAKQAQSIAAQYGIIFSKGKNRFLIQTAKTSQNPLGFRQMSKEELLLLTIDRNAMKTQGYGSVAISEETAGILSKLAQGQSITPQEGSKVLEAIHPIQDKDALDVEELALLKNSTEAFNTTIKNIAVAKDLALFDANKLMQDIAAKKLRIGGVNYSSDFITGGMFSLDGIHPNQRGYGIIANAFIDAINSKYKANLPKVDPNQYKGIVFP